MTAPEPRDSLGAPVVGLEVPPTVELTDGVWHRRPELHITTFTPDDRADAAGLDLGTVLALGDGHRDALTQERPFTLTGSFARVAHEDGRRTVVAFCDVPGLADLYRQLSAAAGTDLECPPTHVTLFTAVPGERGIGLATAAHVAQRATAIEGADLSLLRTSVRKTRTGS